MTIQVILSAVGSDRPGLTQSLADAVLSAGGNWLGSHLSRLGGKYVGSVLVELDESDLSRLQRAIENVDAGGLHVSIVPAGEEPAAPGTALAIELVGQDRPGIVREVAAVLAGLGVNIEDFASRAENSAWSGERLFRAVARLSIPAGTSFDQVQSALESISGEIMVDLTIARTEAKS
ncbi:glycine cleavage system transcriptional repressor [Sphingosinicella rhizophila]|uniref:ACT domain-containing protein n=1 Tax=Sphingosinicella rhizophila TaxID=3050082 RepID=A0ABU3QC20_9SPHN|nr:ACT domain-containing protein [Sphingosinicella sp. GR2756]MDT9600490.1 ACT domain-containing protein [Sphingosinicella sp. GR2756]